MSKPTTATATATATATVTKSNVLDIVDFVIAVENRAITDAEFEASAQAFVDSGVWRGLQGSWQRAVREWASQGLVTL